MRNAVSKFMSLKTGALWICLVTAFCLVGITRAQEELPAASEIEQQELPDATDDTVAEPADDFDQFLEMLRQETDVIDTSPPSADDVEQVERPQQNGDVVFPETESTEDLGQFRETRQDDTGLMPPNAEPVDDLGQSFEPGSSQSADPLQTMNPGAQLAVLRALEKVTARITDLEAPIDEVVVFHSLAIKVRTCNKRPPEETPETSVFIEIDERRPTGETIRLFSGWMFASSPGLSALEHPVYDVWVIDCKTSAPE